MSINICDLEGGSLSTFETPKRPARSWKMRFFVWKCFSPRSCFAFSKSGSIGNIDLSFLNERSGDTADNVGKVCGLTRLFSVARWDISDEFASDCLYREEFG